MRTAPFLAALLLGALVRLAALPLPGTEDVGSWKIWAYAASSGVTSVYGIGGSPPVRGTVQWGRDVTTVDYPPVALYELALIGKAYRYYDQRFRDRPALLAFIKAPGLLCAAVLSWLLYAATRASTGSIAAGRWAALAFWINPATILNGEVLGYLDPWVMLPGVGAFLAAHRGWPGLAGLLLAVAALTKPQGVLLGPAVVLTLWLTGGLRSLVRGGAGAAAAATAIVLPFALAGALPNMQLAFGAFYARRDVLSGYAANIWWIVNYLLRAWGDLPRLGFPGAYLTRVPRIMQVSTVERLGYPNPRPFATAAVLAACAWAAWRVRRSRSLAIHAAFAAFTVHAFFVLSVGVHEHHLILAVPLLALAGGLAPGFRPVFYAVSTIAALNMNLFYGIGIGWGWAVPRMLTPVDLSVLLSAANAGALGWHARVLAREARIDAERIAAGVRGGAVTA